jgi:23S rRNA pseudouridine2605 synthase
MQLIFIAWCVVVVAKFTLTSSLRFQINLERPTSLTALYANRKDAIPYPGYGKKKGEKAVKQIIHEEAKTKQLQEEEIYHAEEDRPSRMSVNSKIKLAAEERINKVLARAGVASRRGADEVLLKGRVMVNGAVIREPGHKVNIKKDVIIVDGERITLPDAKSTYWVAVNKPKGVITSMSDDKDRETLSSLVPKSKDLRIVPVGRLERDTSGLILLTNEVGWLHPLTHRSYKRQPNSYECVVRGAVEEEVIERLKRGGVEVPAVFDPATGDAVSSAAPRTERKQGYQRRSAVTAKKALEMYKLPPTILKLVDVDRKAGLSLLEVTVEEVLPQQMQRMFAMLGAPLLSMKRTEFGPVKLGSLKRGQWREMTGAEVEKLKSSVSDRDLRQDEFDAASGELFDLEEGQWAADSSSSGSSSGDTTTRSAAVVTSSTTVPGGGRRTRPSGSGHSSHSSRSAKKPGAGYAARTHLIALAAAEKEKESDSSNGGGGCGRGGRQRRGSYSGARGSSSSRR